MLPQLPQFSIGGVMLHIGDMGKKAVSTQYAVSKINLISRLYEQFLQNDSAKALEMGVWKISNF